MKGGPPKPTVAFDLDETLGVPLIDAGNHLVGFQLRTGCVDLLTRLREHYRLVLWSVSSRRYVDQVLAFGLAPYFTATYSWDEMPCRWKDVRQVNADYLVDDIADHRESARKLGLERGYIVVPPYGSPDDVANPRLWISVVEGVLQPARQSGPQNGERA